MILKRKRGASQHGFASPFEPAAAGCSYATPTKHLTFLTTNYGKPFSTAGFGNRFRDWCDEAGLSHCSAHGLRKAMAALLAESDATAHQVGAVIGHTSLEEIERYTRAAVRSRLADKAFAKLEIRSGTKVSHSDAEPSIPPQKAQ